MSSEEMTFKGLKISGFIAIFLHFLLVCICIRLFTTGETWAILTGIAGLVLVVLCADASAQPVVNTGTLYH